MTATITFAVTGTIILISGGLLVTKNLTISGPGADQLSIDGNQALLVLGVFPEKTAAISGLTVRNGQIGIWNEQATLSVSNCVINGHSVEGLLNHDGTLAINNCVINGNSYSGINNDGFDFSPRNDHISGIASLTIENSIISDNSGPGVTNTGELTILDSTVSGNSAGSAFFGGGISSGNFKAPGSSVAVINSTISGNSAPPGGSGGGISNDYGFVSIVNSTISGNSVEENGDGGGISNFSGVAEITNSTISGNSAGLGGGVENFEGSVQIANSTISGNSAGSGGGVYNLAGQFGAPFETGNTIFNAGGSGENIVNGGGTVTSDGYNLSSDDGGGYLNGPGDQLNTDPLIGPLQDNGGPTLTHLPLPGSPAIDAGDPNFIRPPFNDQRGRCFFRVFGRRIDIGSVETQPGPRCPTPAPRPTPQR